MPNLVMLVGPPGSGKTTLAKSLTNEDGDNGATTIYVNQDSHGKLGHMEIFREAIYAGKYVIADRMNFNKEQRANYLTLAKEKGYFTKIIVLHENYETCLKRILTRKNHETIKDEKSARSALQTFFCRYERPLIGEADKIEFRYPEGLKPLAIYCDIDGTIADCEHRRHFVRQLPEEIGKSLKPFRKDWNGFFNSMSDDPVILPTRQTLKGLERLGFSIFYCSGRPDNYRKVTEKWLKDRDCPEGLLFMRRRGDSRPDNIVKEILLDFEIKTRYNVFMCLDDRDCVVKMLRNRGLTVFQVADGDF